jgi:two-component system sensor histidine kinase YesM
MILGTVRGKIIANSALILLILASATLYTGLTSSQLARSVEILFRNNLLMEELSKALDRTEASLTGYLTSKSSDALKDYIKYSTRLAEEARKLNRGIRANESLLLQRDLAGLIDSYLEDTEATVTAKRGRDVKGYTERFESAERAARLTRFLIARIEAIFLSDSLVAFSGYNSRISGVVASNAALVLAAAFLGLMLLVRYSYKLTGPLSRLAEAARAVGRGEYDHELPPLQAVDEIGTTAAAFSRMQESIRKAFEELKSKSEVEKRLMEERMRVLDMSHKLKDAELLALQTQINPHFLFNTLSAGMQLAMTEGADMTGLFLENLAAFIRYALKPPSRLVPLSDEIECVERYIWLLRLRFRERFSFEVAVDEGLLSVETPALILQPLVENAVGHGLKDREEGGVVRGYPRRVDGEAVLSVEDTGDGMSPEEMERALREADWDKGLRAGAGELEPAGGGEHGIGLRNVIRRVALVTGERGRVELDSSLGSGTTVRIRLPIGRRR